MANKTSKIGIVTKSLKSEDNTRGIGVNTSELIKALKKLGKEQNLNIKEVSGADDLSSYDLVHYPVFHPYFETLPPEFDTKTIVTIHDLIYLIYKDQYPPGIKGKIKFAKQKKRIQKADAILTISETSKKDIVRFLGIDKSKIFVSYLSSKRVFNPIDDKEILNKVRKKYNLPEKFVLYVGGVNYNKNIPTLIEACSNAGKKLVICGSQAKNISENNVGLYELKGPRDYLRFLFNKPHPEQAHFRKLNEMFKKNNVIRTGFVSDEELSTIYNLATVYVQPSLYEGFGLGVLEAMASGTPVIIARSQALTEIAGDSALVFNPHEPRELERLIDKVFSNKKLRSRQSKKGMQNAKRFSWDKTAQGVIDLYRQVIKS